MFPTFEENDQKIKYTGRLANIRQDKHFVVGVGQIKVKSFIKSFPAPTFQRR